VKKVLFLVLVLFLLTLCAVIAQAQSPVVVPYPLGWKIVFNLNGQLAEVGASDFGSGYAVADQDYLGTHIGVTPDGSYSSVIRYDARTPFSETIAIWNNGPDVFAGPLTWHWQNFDMLWNAYLDGTMPAELNIQLSLPTQGNRTFALDTLAYDPNGGAIDVNLAIGGNPTNGQQIGLNSTAPAVPEPSSLIVLASGLVGLVGVLKRRR
jgi:hypothetical protein